MVKLIDFNCWCLKSPHQKETLADDAWQCKDTINFRVTELLTQMDLESVYSIMEKDPFSTRATNSLTPASLSMSRVSLLSCLIFAMLWSPYCLGQSTTDDGSVLPFPPTPMESVVKPLLQDSTMKWPAEPQRLAADTPNILIVLLDDVGFGVSEVFGGEVSTPGFKKIAEEGIRYNAFHTTAICSPTRASLLTGRNHTRVGSGTIAERAVAFDGFTGIMPKEAATIAEVLHHYGYKTSAFGKWHNTPATETTSMGPFDRWPTGYGFDYFFGFIAGETSQWEPRLTQEYDAHRTAQ